MSDNLFKYTAMIGYMVKKLQEARPGKQIGKTFIQKMIYLLTREGAVRFDYSMYHYGPYSSGVERELNLAEQRGFVDLKWVAGAGYFAEATSKLEGFEELVLDSEKQAIEKLVDQYGELNAIDLSLIATAYYMKDNFDTPDERLSETIHGLKPKYDVGYIEGVLGKGGVL